MATIIFHFLDYIKVRQLSKSILVIALLTSFYASSQSRFQHETYLKDDWELEDNDSVKKNLFRIRPYNKLYILFANVTSNVNEQPTSENALNQVPIPIPYEPVEVKFQLSFKTKALNNIFGKKIGGDLWVTYTQSSRWQLYNKEMSSPFRETNYEPEGLLIFPTHYKLFGAEGVFAGIGLNHQSNGRSLPLSRSWNRVVFPIGFQIKEVKLIVKPWFRIQEETEKDDNPNIEDYMGRAEIESHFSFNKHSFGIYLRHSLKTGDDSRGSARIDYSFQFYNNLKLHAQLFTGYGESMIDYNHNQTTFGVGLSLN